MASEARKGSVMTNAFFRDAWRLDKSRNARDSRQGWTRNKIHAMLSPR